MKLKNQTAYPGAKRQTDWGSSATLLPRRRLDRPLNGVDGGFLHRQSTKYRKLHVIINPASGPDRYILNTLNRFFLSCGVDWDATITRKRGDATRFAQQAAVSGVDAIVAYGGDGTVMEVANGLALASSAVPLAILPGGTTNAIAHELGIPVNLSRAVALVCSDTSSIQALDMGQFGQRFFFHLGIGLQAEMVKSTTREWKDRVGGLAYFASGLRELWSPKPARYELTVDDRQIEIDGMICMITNISSIGLPGLFLSDAIDGSDGILDVVVFPKSDLDTFVSLLAGLVLQNNLTQTLPHWQARKVSVVADPPQSIVLDGEVHEPSPVEAEVLPQAIRVIVPDPAASRWRKKVSAQRAVHSSNEFGDYLSIPD